MGLFGKFRGTGKAVASTSDSNAAAGEHDALRLIDEGNVIEQEGRIAEALQRYESAIQLAPNMARAHLNRGNVLLEMGDVEGALGAYATALAEDPLYAAAHYNAGNAYARSGRADAAVAAYRSAIALKPDFADAEVALGSALEDLGRLDHAVSSYRRALALKPEYAEVYGNLGNTLIKLGRLDDAVASYARAAALNPHRAEAHNRLGRALQAQGRLDDAVRSFRNAIDIDPGHADAHCNLGNALYAIGKLHDALDCYRRALAARPESAEVYGNLGNTLIKLGRLDDAVASYARAAALNPHRAEAHNRLGRALQAHGRLDDAMRSFRNAIDIDPGHADAHCNLGNALYAIGKLHDALDCYRRALAARPESAEVHGNLGNALRGLGRFDEAISSLRRALEINPGLAALHFNLGNVQKDIGKLHDAANSFRRAIKIDPMYADAYYNLGNALDGIGRLNDALGCYRRTVELRRDHVPALNNLGNTLSALGYGDEAVASFREALRLDPCFEEARSGLLFSLNYRQGQGGAMMLDEARRYGDMVARKARPFSDWPNIADPSRRLRVGFVSGDLRNHAVGHFVEGVLAALASRAADRLEIFGYPTHFLADTVTERIKASCSGWHLAAKLSDQDFARQIRDDRVDILIDLSGHSDHNRLSMFAWKPAPVQATWLGYLATTGVAAIDYVIADRWTLPEADAVNFVEKIWYLPKSYLCFTPPNVRTQVTPLPALTERRITFGSFNNLAKVNEAVVALWARLLNAVPESRLFLKAKQFEDVSVRQNVIDRFAVRGIEAERLVLAGHVAMSDYLSPYQKVDIALDPFPYPGITTSVESLWMGVPVMTLAGSTFLSRQGVGLLTNAGLPEWIAKDPDDYVARAAAHASDLHRLSSLRGALRDRIVSSPIFDTEQFADHFATAMRGMWQGWCSRRRGRTCEATPS